MSELLETLRLAADDPMWADHAEIPKKLLRHAADRLEALEREKEELRKERDRCHARLEIDHCFKLGDDDNLIRHEIPLNERSSFPDGITARDETIKLVERRAETAERQLAERDADLTRMRDERAKQIAYSCDLQRIIEGLCGGGEIREPETTARYHYDMAVASRAALAGSGDGWRLVPVEFIEFVKNAPVSSGTCCCGDDMENHANPMSCGHSPVDEWDYSLSKWLKQISASPSTAGER